MVKPRVNRPRSTPREFIVLVGGPSNTFNGYTEIDASGNDVARPKPVTLNDLKKYLPPPPSQPNPTLVGTHDLYWANFLDPVHRLFRLGIASPLPGDIVTVMVFASAYKERSEEDFDASPHNPINRNSPWVLNKFPYDPTVRADEQGQIKPPIKNPPNRKPSPSLSKPVSDRRIDHEILMRTTDEFSPLGHVVRRPTRASHWLDIVHDLPRRCVLEQAVIDFSPPRMTRVLVKMLLMQDKAELFQYLSTGKWVGAHAKHLLDTVDEDDLAQGGIDLDAGKNFDFHAAGKVPPQAAKFWNQLPSVDRKHVKIQRLDYIGHSTKDFILLQYGQKNDKGQVPEGEVFFDADELKSQAFGAGPKPHFAADAECQLWGCNLGQGSGCFAEKLSDLVTVSAFNSESTFEHIVDSDDAMPLVDNGGNLVVFLKPQ